MTSQCLKREIRQTVTLIVSGKSENVAEERGGKGLRDQSNTQGTGPSVTVKEGGGAVRQEGFKRAPGWRGDSGVKPKPPPSLLRKSPVPCPAPPVTQLRESTGWAQSPAVVRLGDPTPHPTPRQQKHGTMSCPDGLPLGLGSERQVQVHGCCMQCCGLECRVSKRLRIR